MPIPAISIAGPMAAAPCDVGGTDGPVSMGTTIMAVTYKGGVILGADSRTSTGSYVANRASDKITALSNNVYVCRSGSAADTQAISSYVQMYIAQHQAEEGEDISVQTAARLVTNIAYQNKDMLQAGMIVAGWDRHKGGSLWGIPLGGTLLQLPFAIGGSGSAYISGFVDKFWKPDMSEEEAKAFIVKAISYAMARDASSGGCIRTVTIDVNGARREFVPGSQVPLGYGEIRRS